MTYTIQYKMHDCAEQASVCVTAANKENAYDKAVYECIPQKEGRVPYSAWVSSVTHRNGKHHSFNTHEGKPY